MYWMEVVCMLLDESMRQLYDGRNGQILSVVTRWMSSDVEHLQNSAALAIGNMARSGNIVTFSRSLSVP